MSPDPDEIPGVAPEEVPPVTEGGLGRRIEEIQKAQEETKKHRQRVEEIIGRSSVQGGKKLPQTRRQRYFSQ